MSDDPFSARRRLSRRQRTSADDRRDRHLELVTDRWIAELADLVVLEPTAHRAVDARSSTTAARRTADREARSDFGPIDFA
jgi:hypothetical protein